MWNQLNPSRRYRNDILSWRAWEMRLSDAALGRKSGKGAPTVARVLRGENASFDTVWAVTDALNIDRQAITNFKLKKSQFQRAVTNGKRG